MNRIKGALIVGILLTACAGTACAQIPTEAKKIFDSIVCNIICLVKYVVLAVAAAVVVVSGLQYATAEDPKVRRHTRWAIIYAFLGLILVLLGEPVLRNLLNSSKFLSTFACECGLTSEQLVETVNELSCEIICLVEYIIAAVAALMMVYAGLRYLVEQDPKARKNMLRLIVHALIGLLIVLFAVPALNYVTGDKVPLLDCDCIRIGGTGGDSGTSSGAGSAGPEEKLPDLAILDVTVEPSDTEISKLIGQVVSPVIGYASESTPPEISFNILTENAGKAKACNPEAVIYLQGEKVCGTTYAGCISPAEKKDIRCNIDKKTVKDAVNRIFTGGGTYKLKAEIDPQKKVKDKNRENNVYEKDIILSTKLEVQSASDVCDKCCNQVRGDTECHIDVDGGTGFHAFGVVQTCIPKGGNNYEIVVETDTGGSAENTGTMNNPRCGRCSDAAKTVAGKCTEDGKKCEYNQRTGEYEIKPSLECTKLETKSVPEEEKPECSDYVSTIDISDILADPKEMRISRPMNNPPKLAFTIQAKIAEECDRCRTIEGTDDFDAYLLIRPSEVYKNNMDSFFAEFKPSKYVIVKFQDVPIHPKKDVSVVANVAGHAEYFSQPFSTTWRVSISSDDKNYALCGDKEVTLYADSLYKQVKATCKDFEGDDAYIKLELVQWQTDKAVPIFLNRVQIGDRCSEGVSGINQPIAQIKDSKGNNVGDPIELYDDGKHNDYNAYDNIFGNKVEMYLDPGEYSIDVTAGNSGKTTTKNGGNFRVLGSLCFDLIEGHNDLNKNRINIVFVGLGFSDVDQFKSSALKVLDFNSIRHGLMAIEPMKENKDKFNFFYVGETRPCSGTDSTNVIELSDYCLGGLWNQKYTFALGKDCLGANILGEGNKVAANVRIGVDIPGEHDTQEVSVHEFGHLVGRLGDTSKQCDDLSEVSSVDFYYGSLEDCRKNSKWKDLIGNGCGKEGVVDCVEKYNPDTNTIICKSGGKDCYLEVDCYPNILIGNKACYRPEYATIMSYRDDRPFSFGPVGIRRFNRIFKCCYPDNCDNFPTEECNALASEDSKFSSCRNCAL